MPLNHDLNIHIASMPLADTHEHLVEEDLRDSAGPNWQLQDFSVFLALYPDSDLESAGMPHHDIELLTHHETPVDKKWKIVKPFWEKIRLTGYGEVVRRSIRVLFDEDDLSDSTWESITDKVRSQIKPGWYTPIIREKANIHHMQVNSLEQGLFTETLYPEWMLQDLSFLSLSTCINVPHIESGLDAIGRGMEISTFDFLVEAVDLVFDLYGPRAVALKNQGAYNRRLDYEWVDEGDAERCFQKYAASGWKLEGAERKPLEDWLFHYCINKSIEYSLPVKLHTGYYAGAGHMPLHRVGANPGDCAELCLKHPRAKFVFMHSMYPYQDELISLTKHFPNAHADMCWSWIVNPAATVRFTAEIIKAAPINKIFLFGGDHFQVELIPGHAEMARHGLALALSSLVVDGWLSMADAMDAAHRLTLGNALELYDVDRCRQRNIPRKRNQSTR
ncbi:MAG: amidohydrolase family protein [Candidatus Sumerlaeia bacterium]|nr:amidohydrolase family protein [Candidatus Sumerlaeia bacterium]